MKIKAPFTIHVGRKPRFTYMRPMFVHSYGLRRRPVHTWVNGILTGYKVVMEWAYGGR